MHGEGEFIKSGEIFKGKFEHGNTINLDKVPTSQSPQNLAASTNNKQHLSLSSTV